MDDNIISTIMLYTNIKCHSCCDDINSIINLKRCIKINKFYYCKYSCFINC